MPTPPSPGPRRRRCLARLPALAAVRRLVTGRHPPLPARHPRSPPCLSISDPARLALELAALGWHILPLSAASKRPLGNCPACRTQPGAPGHLPDGCPCLAGGGWCHGVRAATTDPARITAWWQREPAAVPGVAAGPSGLVLIDIDNHGGPRRRTWPPACCPASTWPPNPIPGTVWDDPARYRDGRDTLHLLARLRGGPRPWPPGPGHQPVSVTTPSGGIHLWYPHPPTGSARPSPTPQAATGWPGKSTSKPAGPTASPPAPSPPQGTYQVRGGDPARPGRMPAWLAAEIHRVTTPRTIANRRQVVAVRRRPRALPPTWPLSSPAVPLASPA